MSHIFISYSKKDIVFARALRALLQDKGFAVWMDETRLVPSNRWWPTIEKNIITCSAFIVIMSGVGMESDWVERELLVAENKKKPIFPVLLEGVAWSRLGNIQFEDMRFNRTTLRSEFVEGLRKVSSTSSKISTPHKPRTTGFNIQIGAMSLQLIAICSIVTAISFWAICGNTITVVSAVSSIVEFFNQFIGVDPKEENYMDETLTALPTSTAFRDFLTQRSEDSVHITATARSLLQPLDFEFTVLNGDCNAEPNVRLSFRSQRYNDRIFSAMEDLEIVALIVTDKDGRREDVTIIVEDFSSTDGFFQFRIPCNLPQMRNADLFDLEVRFPFAPMTRYTTEFQQAP